MKIEYNRSYYDNLKKQHSNTAKVINEIRWNFVKDIPFKNVLDYGCGCGELSLFSPEKVSVDSYDIGMLNGSSYPQTGITRQYYDLTFFNDVIEHVDWVNSPDENMIKAFNNTAYICISVPVWSGLMENVHTWKHYKPGEHLYYFSEDSVIDFFIKRNMSLIKRGYPECPPRQDIFSGIFKKN